MQHGVAPTLTDTPVAFTLKNIVALTLKVILHLPWNLAKYNVSIECEIFGCCKNNKIIYWPCHNKCYN